MTRNEKEGVRIHFRFHGDLIELLAPSKRCGEYETTVARRTSIKDAVESQGVPHVEVSLLLAGGLPCDWSYLLERDTALDVYSMDDAEDIPDDFRVIMPDPKPLRFLLDVHLGRLASYLRLLGFDTAYNSDDPGDDQLARRAHAESRILLSCDRGLLMRNHVQHGHLLHSRNSIEQTREIIQRYKLAPDAAPFTRCLTCNGVLEAVDMDAIRERIPPRVFRRWGDDPDRYRSCPACGKLYWEGTHTDRMRRLLAEWSVEG